VQIGLLDPALLPVSGSEQADRLLELVASGRQDSDAPDR
jgi:hypothetical protein